MDVCVTSTRDFAGGWRDRHNCTSILHQRSTIIQVRPYVPYCRLHRGFPRICHARESYAVDDVDKLLRFGGARFAFALTYSAAGKGTMAYVDL